MKLWGRGTEITVILSCYERAKQCHSPGEWNKYFLRTAWPQAWQQQRETALSGMPWTIAHTIVPLSAPAIPTPDPRLGRETCAKRASPSPRPRLPPVSQRKGDGQSDTADQGTGGLFCCSKLLPYNLQAGLSSDQKWTIHAVSLCNGSAYVVKGLCEPSFHRALELAHNAHAAPTNAPGVFSVLLSLAVLSTPWPPSFHLPPPTVFYSTGRKNHPLTTFSPKNEQPLEHLEHRALWLRFEQLSAKSGTKPFSRWPGIWLTQQGDYLCGFQPQSCFAFSYHMLPPPINGAATFSLHHCLTSYPTPQSFCTLKDPHHLLPFSTRNIYLLTADSGVQLNFYTLRMISCCVQCVFCCLCVCNLKKQNKLKVLYMSTF